MSAGVWREGVANVLFMLGNGNLQEGRVRRALWQLSMASRLVASNAHYAGTAAMAAARAGDVDATLRLGERALELDARMDAVRQVLAGLFLKGERYTELLARIHRYLEPRTYLEIGVDTGVSMRLVAPTTRAIGIDPEPKLTEPPAPHVRVFREKSDEFFARHDVRAELGGLPVELAFIDGMHLFEYALRDFMNVERYCTPASTIIIHDCFPMDRRTAERERGASFWTGDVWKLVVLLKKYRPELAVYTVATPPSGLCIVRRLDPASRVIADNLQRLTDEFMRLDYSFLAKDRATKLNLFPNDWARVRALLD